MSRKVAPQSLPGQDLFEAIKAKDTPRVLSLLERADIDLDWADPEEGKTPLHIATEAQDCVYIALLLGKGGKVHLRDKQGKSPLNLSLESGNDQCIQLLANKAISCLEEAHRKKVEAEAKHNFAKPPIYEYLMNNRTSLAATLDREEGDMKMLKAKLENLTSSGQHQKSKGNQRSEEESGSHAGTHAHETAAQTENQNADQHSGQTEDANAHHGQQQTDQSADQPKSKSKGKKNKSKSKAAKGEEGEITGHSFSTGLLEDSKQKEETEPQKQEKSAASKKGEKEKAQSVAKKEKGDKVPASKTEGTEDGGDYFEKHIPRASFMSQMLEISHFQTIYNIFVALLVLNFLTIITTNYLETGLIVDLSLFFWCFGDFHLGLALWGVVFCYSFLVVPLQKAIIEKHAPGPAFYYLLYALSILVLYGVPPVIVLNHKFPVATGFFIMAEVVRISMKMHSFMMTNRALMLAKKNGVPSAMVDLFPNNVNLGNYFYFMWAPTLVYQPAYPRTEKIRPLWVIGHFLETLFSIFYTYSIFVRYCLPLLSMVTGDARMVMYGVFQLMIPSTTVLLLGFYGILHCWLNAFAELTRFADRQFYRDWWNSTDWAMYYRKWNVVVHKFLYYHIFVECLHFGFGKNMSLLITFMISAIMHEYIIACAMGFYKPILLILFGGPGVIFIYLTKNWKMQRVANIFMWLMLFIGNGMLCVFYSRAWHIFYKDKDLNTPFSWSDFWGLNSSW